MSDIDKEKKAIIDLYETILSANLIITIKDFVNQHEKYLISNKILPQDIELMIKVTDLCFKHGVHVPESKL